MSKVLIPFSCSLLALNTISNYVWEKSGERILCIHLCVAFIYKKKKYIDLRNDLLLT